MLTRHFATLQGLRLIAVSVLLQFVTSVWQTTRGALWTLLAAVAAYLVEVVVIAVVDRYYARFGRVVAAAPPRWARHVCIVLLAITLPLPFPGLPSIPWTVLAAVPLWVAWDCRPYRWHHLLTAAAMLYVAFGRVAYPNAGDLAWMAPRMWVFTTTLVVCGILDHLVFMRAMRETRGLAGEQTA